MPPPPGQLPRRVGQNRYGAQPLLGQVRGKSRAEHDRDSRSVEIFDDIEEDSSDELSKPTTLAPTKFTNDGRPGRPTAKRHKNNSYNSAPDSPDDLAMDDAPDISERRPAKPRSRQASVDPAGKTASDRGSRSTMTAEEALVSAGRSVAPAARLPGRNWDDGLQRPGRTKSYGKPTYAKKTTTYGSEKKKAPASQPKEETPKAPYIVSSDSDTDLSIGEKEKENKRPTVPSKKKARKGTAAVDGDTNGKTVKASEWRDINKYNLPPAPPLPPKPETTFIDPRKKYGPIEVRQEAYDECGVNKEKPAPKSAFLDPFSKYGELGLPGPSKSVGEFDEYRNGLPDKDIVDITSSPVPITSSQSSGAEPAAPAILDNQTTELLNEMAVGVGITDLQALKARRVNDGKDRCKLCDYILPPGYLDDHRDWTRKGFISLQKWQEICQDHKLRTLREEWIEKGYPDIKWAELKDRVMQHEKLLKDIIANKTPSHFREEFAREQKETGGLTVKLLKQDRKLPNPGYYGPRGGEILLHIIMSKLGSRVSNAAKRDPLISGSSVSAFIQHVLVLEVAVQLIMEDMKVSQTKARRIMEESRPIGEKLNSTTEKEDLYGDDDSRWIDVNAASTQKPHDEDEWLEMDY